MPSVPVFIRIIATTYDPLQSRIAINQQKNLSLGFFLLPLKVFVSVPS